MEPPREHERHRDLHDLGGLDGGDADVEPPARAVAHVAEERHRDEQHEARDVEREGQAHQHLGMDLRQHPEGGEGDREVAHLAEHAIERCAAGGGIDHGRAERHGERQRRHQRAVDAPRDEVEDAANHSRPRPD